jgi:hypothetical protein
MYCYNLTCMLKAPPSGQICIIVAVIYFSLITNMEYFVVWWKILLSWCYYVKIFMAWVWWFSPGWANYITHCPSSSISMARFVTGGAIDLKLCSYVTLDQMTSQTKFRSDPNFGLATRGQNIKHAITPAPMAGSSCTNGWIFIIHRWSTFQGEKFYNGGRFSHSLSLDFKFRPDQIRCHLCPQGQDSGLVWPRVLIFGMWACNNPATIWPRVLMFGIEVPLGLCE